jgi:GTPase SAR1 family protein
MDDVNKITANENPFKIILGNKCDLDYKKEVNKNDIAAFQEQAGIDIFEISAKESIKINEVFELITTKLIKRHESKNNNIDNTKNVYSLYNEDGGEIKPKTQNCC